MIIRSYACLNRRCRHEFDSEGDFPPCPRCRGIRVQWVPKPVAINSSRTAAIDKTARELAADFGLTNFRSPQVGEPVATRHTVTVPPPPASANAPVFEPARGWRINLPAAALEGQGRAVCAPTGVTAKIQVDPNAGGLKENPGYGMDKMRAATQIEATHRARIPR